MKVFIVNWFSAEEYTNESGVEKIFYNKEKAKAFVDKHQHVVLDEDLENYNYGRMISNRIQEIEISE